MVPPANEWNNIVPPQPWSLVRNLPLMLQGLGVAYLILRDARTAHDRPFVWIGVSILVSYACYLPVILFVQQAPAVGMLMIPKTWPISQSHGSVTMPFIGTTSRRWHRPGEKRAPVDDPCRQLLALKRQFRGEEPMHKLILPLLIAALVAGGCSTTMNSTSSAPPSIVQGSGTTVTKPQAVSAFDRVEIDNTFNATVELGPAESVTVTADDNVMPYVLVTQKGKTISIGLAPNSSVSNATLKVAITAPDLRSLSADGASAVTITGANPKAQIEISDGWRKAER
ncbi:MAG: DUF2807 domain-containing protein [Anaerolineales bacterium]|nr:DUF2807 domain-containing protein [Anaerolineales bacterium]